MQKGANAFQSYKKRLTRDYVKKGLTPDFQKKGFEKFRDHCYAFVQYKESEDAIKKIETNTINARKKKEFHTLKPGGYKKAIPKWDREEHEIMSKGIIPATLDWPERAKYYYCTHGGKLNPRDGTLVLGDQLREIAARLVEFIRLAAEGTFVPDRENDELTMALGTKEHGGRCRGKGVIPWKEAFLQHIDSYRSRKRTKDQQA